MMNLQQYLKKEIWNNFVSKVRDNSPICFERIKQYIKIKKNSFPTDQMILDYYESIFSKITCSANRTKWHEMDKFLLIWCVTKVLQLRGKEVLIPEQQDWEYISQLLQVGKQLLELKWLSLLHSNLQIKQWTAEEDEKLISICKDLLQKNNWTEITLKFNSISQTQRYPKQIRERFNNVLNPNLHKTQWKQEEKEKLLELVKQNGKRWSKIQKHFKEKSENQLKTQYDAMCKSIKKQEKFQEFNSTLNLRQEQIAQCEQKQFENSVPNETPKLEHLNKQDQTSVYNQPVYSNFYATYQQQREQQYYQTIYRYNPYNYFDHYRCGNSQFLNYYQY